MQLSVPHFAEQRADDSLCGPLSHARVVVGDGQQHDGVHDHVERPLGRLKVRSNHTGLVESMIILLLLLYLSVTYAMELSLSAIPGSYSFSTAKVRSKWLSERE